MHLLCPVNSIREKQRRAGLTPVNHHRHNRLALKEQSAKNAARKAEAREEEATAKKNAFRPNSARPPRPASARPGTAASSASVVDQYGVDYVSMNKTAVVNAAAQRGAALRKKLEERDRLKNMTWTEKKRYHLGEVPGYLLARKEELAEAARVKREMEERSHIPVGMRVLPEEERVKTLEILRENREDTYEKLRSLPFKCETPSSKRTKAALEFRLAEIEDAQKVFSRNRVLVREVPEEDEEEDAGSASD
jgi:hypothetical protein